MGSSTTIFAFINVASANKILGVFLLVLLICGPVALNAQKSFQRASVDAQGQPSDSVLGSAISADGNVFAWYDLSGIFTHNIQTEETLTVNIDENGNSVGATRPNLSADGRYVTFLGTDLRRVYLRDTVSETTTWVNPGTDALGPNANCFRPLISADGNLVAYGCLATNLVENDSNGTADVFIYNHTAGTTTLGMLNSAGEQFSPTLGFETEYDLSADGRYLFFSTTAAGVHGDTPAAFFTLYRRNLATGEVELVSRAESGAVASGSFATPKASYDGNAFTTSGSNVEVFGGDGIIPGFSHSNAEIYVVNLSTNTVWRASATADGLPMNSGIGGGFDISGDGASVAFSHRATNIDPTKVDVNLEDVFLAVYDGDAAATVTRLSLAPDGSELALTSRSPVFAKQADVFAYIERDADTLLGTNTGFSEGLIAYGEFSGGGGDVFGGTAIEGFPGWRASSWYKNYNAEFWPWIFHDEHGWQFVSASSTSSVIFLWDLGLGQWVFLNEGSYRWIFIFGGDQAGWVFTFGDNTPGRRFFQRLDDGSLFSVPPDLPVN